MLSKISAIAVSASLVLALVVPTAASAQTIDCSALSSRADQLVCQNPSIGRQKADYEKLLMQLRRANPGSLDDILAINRQKLQELHAECKTPECISDWYSGQTAALRDGTWATQPKRSAVPVTSATVAPDAATQPSPPPQSNPDPVPASNSVAQSPQPSSTPVQQAEAPQERVAPTAEEPSTEESDFKAWQASQASQGKEPEPQAQRTVAEAQTPEPSRGALPKKDALEELFDGFGVLTLVFSALIGLPFAYPFWKVIVWLDQYFITRAERYHRSAGVIFLTQVAGGLACGLFVGFVIVAGFQYVVSLLFRW